MRKKRLTSAIACLFAVLFMFPMSVSSDGLTDATVMSYEEQLADLQRKQEQAQEQLEGIQYEKNTAWSDIQRYDEAISYNTQIKTLVQNELDAISLQIETKKQNILDAQDKIERQQAAFLNRMARNYMEENVSYVELLLGASSLYDFLTRLDRVQAIVDYDKTIIADLKNEKARLEKEKADLEKAESDQLLRIADYEKAISDNQQLYQQKQDYMASLNSDETRAREAYAYYKQQEDELNAQLEAYLAELARKSQSVYVGGTGGWPLEPGVTYYVSSEFGWRELWGSSDFHLGIDLACAYGTGVYAKNAGTVLISEEHWSYGNYVLIDHGGGISTLYAHMTERYVAAGDYVVTGQQVGQVGLTGNTSGPHLHFEVRVNGEVTQPRDYLMFP